MSAELATFALALLCALGFAAVTALLSAFAWPVCWRWVRHRHPVVRARAAFAFALAPVAVPLALLGLCLAPGLASGFGWYEDHCLRHTEHAHLCFAHPNHALDAPLVAVLTLICVGIFAAAVRSALRLARWRRDLADLPLETSGRLAADVRIVQSERPISVTLGLLRPEIWISTGLLEALSLEQREAVIAHERSHARRLDSLRRLLARVGSLAHWPGLRRALQSELALATEQLCDEAAARLVRDRLTVAEAILTVERLLARAPAREHPVLAGFGGSAVEARVQSLLGADPGEPMRGRFFWLAPASLAAAVVLVDPLHHATEHVLGLLLRVL